MNITMRSNKVDFEHLLIILIVAVGVGVRIIGLGRTPLSNYEAENALQALAIATGADPGTISQPGYVFLTSPLFFVFEGDNFSARLIPALAGGALLLSVIGFRRLLGKATILILVLGLAIDPGMVAVSRLADSSMIALASAILCLTSFYHRQPVLAGIAGALALMSGRGMFGGLVGLVLAIGIGSYLYKTGRIGAFWDDRSSFTDNTIWGAMSRSAGATLILIGTLFFSTPNGVGSIFNGLSSYLVGWLKTAGVPAGRLIFALLIYQPLPVMLALIAIVEGWRNRKPTLQWLSIWASSAMLATVIYPSRQVYDLIWAIVPIWVLAAVGLARFLNLRGIELLPAGGQAVLIVLLASLSWINVAGLSLYPVDYQTYQLRWALIFGTFILGAVATILVGFGWSFKTARHGLIWGLVCAFGLYTLSNLWGAARFRSFSENEFWHPGPVVQQSVDLVRTLSEISQWRTGIENSLDITILSNEPSIKWSLREWPSARFRSAVPSGELPSAIITSADQDPIKLATGYRGQDFSWEVSPDWNSNLPPNWLEWLVFRKTPQKVEKVILWVRSDLFPGGVIQSEAESTQQDEDILIPNPVINRNN